MRKLTCTSGTLSVLLALGMPVAALANAAGAGPLSPQAEGGPQGQSPPAVRAAPRGPRPPEVAESFSRTVRLGNRDGFELATGFGQITITGVNGDDVKVDAVKRVYHSNRDAGRALLQSVQILITDRGGIVEALTDFTGRGAPVFVDYTVSLPRRASVSLKTLGGDIRVSNVSGELRVEAASGNVTLESVGSIRRAKTFAGSVTITEANGNEVNAETTAGALQVRNVRARTMELSTISGNLTVSDGRCERCTLKTISGELEFTGPLTRGGRYDFQSQKGNIRLIPTGPVNFDLEARTFQGRPQSDYPLKGMTAREGTLRGS